MQASKMKGDDVAVSEAINKFSKALYQVLCESSDNLVVSPFSVEAVVAMLLLGMRGNTQKKVAAALFLPETSSQMAQGFKSIFTSLQATQDVILEIASKIYIQQDFHVKEEFQKETKDYFNSTTEEVDIAGKTEDVILAVNDWAARKTHDKIQNLLDPGMLTRDVVLILLNAIYFKGLWEKQFDQFQTDYKPFHLSSKSVKNVPMMNLTEHLLYTKLSDVCTQVLKLPYKGSKYSMIIFLPQDKNGLKKLESKIDKLNISKIQQKFRSVEVIVALPRFKILTTIDLNEPLVKVGMGQMFTAEADLTGVSEKKICVDKVLQKAYIEVNEEGTEAAAVTAMSCCATSLRSAPLREYFIADHPFLYMIIAENKGTILFMGRVVSP